MKLRTSKGGSTVAAVLGLLVVFLIALAAGLYFRLAPELTTRRAERSPAWAERLRGDLARRYPEAVAA